MKLEFNTKHGLFNKKEKEIMHDKYIKALIKAVGMSIKEDIMIDVFKQDNIGAFILSSVKNISCGIILQVSMGNYITTSYNTNNIRLLTKIQNYNDKKSIKLYDEHHSTCLDLAKVVQ